MRILKIEMAILLSLASASASAQPLPGSRADEAEPVRLELPVEPGGLTARDVALRAVQVAPEVRQSEILRDQAQDTADVSGWLGFAPRLDLSATYTRLSEVDQPAIEFGGQTFELFPQILDNYALRASVRVPVLSYFLTVWPTYEAAQHSAEVSVHQARAERALAALRAQEVYFGLARATAARIVAEDAIAQLEAHIEDLVALFGAGEATQADVMQARAQLADARVQRTELDGAVQLSQITLRRRLDLEPDHPMSLGEDLFATVDTQVVSRSELVEVGLAERWEVRALESLRAFQTETIRAHEGGRWPSLDLVANFDYANPNPRAIPQEERFSGSWDLRLVLSWSPNAAVESGLRADQAEVELARVENDLETLRDGIVIEVAQAATDLEVAQHSSEAALEGVAAAREAWRVQRDLLGAGEATPNDVLDAEAALRQAQFALVDAYVANHLARARLAYATGGSPF